MEKLISVRLAGRSTEYRLDEDAYQVLQQFMDRARARLGTGSDGAKALGDLEGSIADRLTATAGDGPVTRADIENAIAGFDLGPEPAPASAPAPAARRRLCRIEEDQWLAGVCTGLSAYSGIRLDWTRVLFLALTLFTGGALVLVYVALAFALPVVKTKAEFLAMQPSPSP
jgi:phage shock protein PspC (stress-responsive transcriptional regulator)